MNSKENAITTARHLGAPFIYRVGPQWMFTSASRKETQALYRKNISEWIEISGMQTRQELFLVVGGELSDVTKADFSNTDDLHTVGVYSTYEEAERNWRANTQRTVDNAQMRYFVVPLTLPPRSFSSTGGSSVSAPRRGH